MLLLKAENYLVITRSFDTDSCCKASSDFSLGKMRQCTSLAVMRAQTNPNKDVIVTRKKSLKTTRAQLERQYTQNYRKQIHNLEGEYNSCPRKATEIVIFKELL